MHNFKNKASMLKTFKDKDKKTLRSQMKEYDEFLRKLPRNSATPGGSLKNGILALNGASGSGQSYVLKEVEKLLNEKDIVLPRIYLLGTRPRRKGEGYKDPYIFVKKINRTNGNLIAKNSKKFQSIHHIDSNFYFIETLDQFNPHPDCIRIYKPEDIYYDYESRPRAVNAILLKDARRAQNEKMYLETVIPTLLKIKKEKIKIKQYSITITIPAWGDKLKIVYLAVPSSEEWLDRLLGRTRSELKSEKYRDEIMKRVESSIADMEEALKHKVPTVLNEHGKGDQAAKAILSIWGL